MTTDELLNGMANLKATYFYSPKNGFHIKSKDKYLKLASQRPNNCLEELKGDFDIIETLDNYLHKLKHPDLEPVQTLLPITKAELPKVKVKQPIKSKIFISYAHYDVKYLEQLSIHLKAMAFDVNIEAWDDRRLRSSNNWYNEIIKALNEASDIILLVSAAFLASDFIRRKELPLALNSAQTKGVRIHSVILSPCRFTKVKSIAAFQSPNNPDKPISACTFHEQELIWDTLCDDIEEFLEENNKKL